MSPEDRLAAIESRLERIERLLLTLVAAWDRFSPLLEKFSKRLARKAEKAFDPWGA